MAVKFRDITEDNFDECVKLKVRADQPYVAPNVYSIAQAKVDPDWTIKAIYADDAMVGFAMYVLDPEVEHELYLCRFMVGELFQGKGYGTAALGILRAEAEATPGIQRMKLSTRPDNANGIRVYERFGFVDTGVLDDGEEVFVLELSSPA